MSLQVNDQVSIGQRDTAANGSTATPRDTSRRSDPREQFGIVPYGIVSDPNLKASEVRLLFGLTYWAIDKESTTVSDAKLAEFARMSVSQVQRNLGKLIKANYIRSRDFTPTKRQPGGREIILLWRVDVSIVPVPMAREHKPEREYKPSTRRRQPEPISPSSDPRSHARDHIPKDVAPTSPKMLHLQRRRCTTYNAKDVGARGDYAPVQEGTTHQCAGGIRTDARGGYAPTREGDTHRRETKKKNWIKNKKNGTSPPYPLRGQRSQR